MAYLVRQQKTFYVDATGKRVPKGAPGAKKVRTKSAMYYGVGVPGQPPKKRVPLATDKASARRMLDDLVRGAERGRADLPALDAGRKPLSDYLTTFERDAGLGLASRTRNTRRQPSPAQVTLTVQRVRDILDGCGFAYPTDLNDGAPAKLAGYLQYRATLPRKDGGLSQQTAAFFLAAARRFAWWLSARAKAPVRADLFADVPGFDPKSDRRHARREIGPDELARLLNAARTSARVIRGLTGEDRYFLYLTAFSTGFRAGELAVLCPENFELDGGTPLAILPAKHTKNRKPVRQPLPPGVAAQLRGHLAGKPAGFPVWPGTWSEKPVKVLVRDLAAAGVPYAVSTVDGPRYADFHALRHSFLSALAAGGTGPKELQELARHSDPRLTLGVYTHARPEALAASVARLDLPGTGGAENPLASMTRGELEAAIVGLLGVVALLVGPRPLEPITVDTPRDTPLRANAGDDPGPAGTGKGRKASAGK